MSSKAKKSNGNEQEADMGTKRTENSNKQEKNSKKRK